MLLVKNTRDILKELKKEKWSNWLMDAFSLVYSLYHDQIMVQKFVSQFVEIQFPRKTGTTFCKRI